MRAVALTIFTLSAIARAQPVASPRMTGTEASRATANRLAHASTDERVKAYETMLRTSPNDALALAGLISAYLQKLRETADFRYLDRASQLVDRMLENDGGNFEALRFENEIDLQRHDFKAVADRSADMAKYNPSDPGIWGNLGDSLMELGEYNRAFEAYLTMFRLRPNLGSYNRLSYIRFVTGNVDAAIGLMKEAIAADSPMPENTAWCWAELGDMYFKTGKLSDAREAYGTALKLFPTLHRASAGLAKTEAAQGETEAAIRDYRRAQSIVPMVEYAGALEDLYTSAGMPAEARGQRELIEAIEKLGAAANEKTNRNLALILADHGRNPELALRLMRAEITGRPDVYTWDALSWVLFRSGHPDEARDASARALKLQTPEPLFYYHAAAIANAAGDREAGRRYAERLMHLNPRFEPGRDLKELLPTMGEK